jgi:hypothetical protein
MLIVLGTLGVAFAAFVVWLTVRIVNRRERWAKWTLATVIVVPVLYVMSIGPAAWIAIRTGNLKLMHGWFWAPLETVVARGPDQLVTRYGEYVFWWMEAAGGQPEYEIGPAFHSCADE